MIWLLIDILNEEDPNEFVITNDELYVKIMDKLFVQITPDFELFIKTNINDYNSLSYPITSAERLNLERTLLVNDTWKKFKSNFTN
jgi:hypothetical protein